MQVTEVRLGNLVAYKDHYQTPEVVDALNKQSEKINGHDAKDFNGIPLTEQWLEDFGFIKDDRTNEFWKPGNDLVVRQVDSWFFAVYDHKHAKLEMRRIESVHDLQNLVFVIDNQELELKTQSHDRG